MSEVCLEFLDGTLKELGSSLVSFYHGVITTDESVSTSDEKEAKRALNKLRRKYVKKLRQNLATSISFESSTIRNAYLFQYCPSFTGAVASNFAKFLKAVPDYVRELCLKDSVTVCCLGGGPATEVVAIYFVLKDVLLNNPLTNGAPLKLKVVIVDVEDGWTQTAARVVSKLQEHADASCVKLKFEFSFLAHDVTSPMTQEVRQVLEASDVVTMVKFLSAIHGASTDDVRSTIIQGVCDHLPLNSTLISLDSSGWKYVDEVAVAIDSCEKMTRVYGMEKTTRYRLSSASKSLCLKLYSKRYGPKYCTVSSLNKIGVWRKMAQGDNEVDLVEKFGDLMF